MTCVRAWRSKISRRPQNFIKRHWDWKSQWKHSGNSGVFVYPSEFAGSNKATAASWMDEDVAGTVEALKAKGVSFEHYDNIPGMTLEGDVHSMGNMKSAWFKDPDGNILNIVNQAG
jgi:hypothetical protein